MNKIDFKDEAVFERLEESAIDGSLIYDDYPPCEYKYFSRLSKLGYKNRHDGWGKELCEQLQADYRRQYLADRADFEYFYSMACRMQENIRRGEMALVEVHKAETVYDKLTAALEVLELILCEEGLAKRAMGNLRGKEGSD